MNYSNLFQQLLKQISFSNLFHIYSVTELLFQGLSTDCKVQYITYNFSDVNNWGSV